MVTEEKIKEWKEKYGSVFKTTINGKSYYYHSMDRDTYLNIIARQQVMQEEYDNDMEVFKACILSDYNENELLQKAGIVSVISEKIMLVSGFELAETEEL
jgi:hypothetical protein